MGDLDYLKNIANSLRRDVLRMTSCAGSGHPTSCLSCAEIFSVLFFKIMKYDITNPDNPNNDEFILSKGHAAPILYASLQKAGCINEDLMSLRKLWSHLEGHPMPSSLKWIKVATGSLGQGLSIGVGMAMAAKLSKKTYKTYVLLGDSEISEGSIWEAVQIASHYSLNNLIAVVDINKLGQRGETMLGHNMQSYKKIFESFGWKAIIVDGHDIIKLSKAFDNLDIIKKPIVILAKTKKGKGISFLEGKEGWHGRTLTKEELEIALSEIPEEGEINFKIEKPISLKIKETKIKKIEESRYKKGELISTREAYGKALTLLAKADKKTIVIDAETSNSTFTSYVKKNFPEQFLEAFIAEQNMIGMSLGLSKKGFNVFASTFAAFLTRAHDQLRMASLSLGNFSVCGSHCGVSVGEDGASQMGLEDISLFRTLPNSIILYPSDAVSCEKLVLLASKLQGIKYIRTTRPKTEVIYSKNEEFLLGDFKVLKESKEDVVVLVGSGVTLFEALRAHCELLKKNIKSAVVDLYCIKPFNKEKFLEFVKNRGGLVVVSEDHYKEGGIGEMLSESLINNNIKIKHLGIEKIPHSGTFDELMVNGGINAKSIENAALELIKTKTLIGNNLIENVKKKLKKSKREN